jgi:hypothetical protein
MVQHLTVEPVQGNTVLQTSNIKLQFELHIPVGY